MVNYLGTIRLIFYSLLLLSATFYTGCNDRSEKTGTTQFDADKYIVYCSEQTRKTLEILETDTLFPRSIEKGTKNWSMVPVKDWTSGFWPGILWYLYEATNDSVFQEKATYYTELLEPLAYLPADNHDLGFMINCSYGNGFRLSNNPKYKEIILAASDTLATLFNPKVGTFLSWPEMVKKMNWPHNTIIDNMMNLEILFWASKHGGSERLYDISVEHALRTMRNQFREDNSVYHVVVYDTTNGQIIKRITHQGYEDETMWARGQAWAIYGFTMCYRETKKTNFLNFAQKVADIYLKRLPEDLIPFWDFDAPNIPNEPKDASAAAITASALLELCTYIKDKSLAESYKDAAVKMLESLCDRYLSKEENPAFLLHSTGHWPNKSEIDVSINYADYYFIEALLRYKKLKEGKLVLANL